MRSEQEIRDEFKRQVNLFENDLYGDLDTQIQCRIKIDVLLWLLNEEIKVTTDNIRICIDED